MGSVIVAGGATGIGRACVRGFRARGDDVLLVDNNPQAAAVAEEDGAGRCRFVQCDLADPAAPAAAVAEAVAAHGGLDCVLVTAAIMQQAALPDWTDAMWNDALALNLKMPFFFAQAAAPHLARSDNASILFVSSTAALRGQAGAAAYQSSKAALPALTRSLTAELGPQGIRVNSVLPGWIETPFNDTFWQFQADPAAKRAAIDAGIPLRRHGTADEVAAVILFLTSEGGRYVAGTSVVIDGGYTAC